MERNSPTNSSQRKSVVMMVFMIISLSLPSFIFAQDIKSLSDYEYKRILKYQAKPREIVRNVESKIVTEEHIQDEKEIYAPIKIKPLVLLRFLATKPKGYVVISTVAENWVSKEDVAELIKYVNSRQPAKPVMSMVSSFEPRELSNVGIEAMCIISSYRGKKYPPLNSGYYFCKPENQDKLAQEYIQWWEAEKNKNSSPDQK